jgi:hypothetical protein
MLAMMPTDGLCCQVRQHAWTFDDRMTVTTLVRSQMSVLMVLGMWRVLRATEATQRGERGRDRI